MQGEAEELGVEKMKITQSYSESYKQQFKAVFPELVKDLAEDLPDPELAEGIKHLQSVSKCNTFVTSDDPKYTFTFPEQSQVLNYNVPGGMASKSNPLV